jgi:hypothetical protein
MLYSLKGLFIQYWESRVERLEVEQSHFRSVWAKYLFYISRWVSRRSADNFKPLRFLGTVRYTIGFAALVGIVRYGLDIHCAIDL